MAEEQFTIGQCGPDQLRLVLEWAAEAGRNPGIHDAACFYAADPQGFFLAELGGKPIGCLAAVAYDQFFGFMGLFIVKPEYRGQGYGRQLSEAGLRYLGNRNIGLDGRLDRVDQYRSQGFRFAYRNLRYQGIGAVNPVKSPRVIDLAQFPPAELLAYDSKLFPAPRPDFLKLWVQQPGTTALGFQVNHKLIGYGVVRRCQRGYRIGPLFADDLAVAEELFKALSDRAPGETLAIDTPQINPAAVDLVKRQGMKLVGETARMYSREFPKLPLHRIFGVTSLELG